MFSLHVYLRTDGGNYCGFGSENNSTLSKLRSNSKEASNRRIISFYKLFKTNANNSAATVVSRCSDADRSAYICASTATDSVDVTLRYDYLQQLRFHGILQRAQTRSSGDSRRSSRRTADLLIWPTIRTSKLNRRIGL